jgi:hypothetical protein
LKRRRRRVFSASLETKPRHQKHKKHNETTGGLVPKRNERYNLRGKTIRSGRVKATTGTSEKEKPEKKKKKKAGEILPFPTSNTNQGIDNITLSKFNKVDMNTKNKQCCS